MSRIIRATVFTNSCEDPNARVQLRCPGIWEDSSGTPLIESVGGLSLKKGDIVFVDVSDGFENPLIIGRAMGSLNSYGKELNGTILWESSDGSHFTVAFVKCNKLEIYNSDGVAVVADAAAVSVKSSTLSLEIGDTYNRSSKTANISDETYNLSSQSATVSANSLTLESASAKITGGQLEIAGKASLDMQGGFCGITNCLFTGAPHCGKTITGT